MTINPPSRPAPSVHRLTPGSASRTIDAWLDGVEHGWAIAALLAGFVASWMLIFTLAYQGADLHPDVLEVWSLGRSLAWGYPKHPPLSGWIAWAWSTIFPPRDWAMLLLALINAAAALLCVDLIARRFVRGDKRIVILLLLMLLPAYQFHAQRFNANSVLLAPWPLATYGFLRSFEGRAPQWAIFAGVAGAVAILGKYYSAFLIGGFAVASVVHPDRRTYWSSSAPWLSAAAGLVVLAPHMVWLTTHAFTTFDYATRVHVGGDLADAALAAVKFVIGNAAYLALPSVALLAATRGRTARLLRDLRDSEGGLLLLWLVFAATLVLPAVVAIAMGSNLPAVWNLQGLFLAVIAAVAAMRFDIRRQDTRRLAVMVMAIAAMGLIVAPCHALYRNAQGYGENRTFLRLSADELTRQWRAITDAPMFAVTGNEDLALGAAFYGPDHPVYARLIPGESAWGPPQQTTLDRGWSALCLATDPSCVHWIDELDVLSPGMVRREFTVTSHLWGLAGATAHILALMHPPPQRQPD